LLGASYKSGVIAKFNDRDASQTVVKLRKTMRIKNLKLETEMEKY